MTGSRRFPVWPLGVLAALVLVVGATSLARAQAACEEGRVRTEDGRCCWPAQTFDAAHGVCVGEPECPNGLVVHGDTCVARLGTGAPIARQQPPPAPPQPAAPQSGGPWSSQAGGLARVYGETTDNWPETPPDGELPARAAMRRGEDEVLITLALAMYDFGYVLGWIVAWDDLANDHCMNFETPAGTFITELPRVNCGTWPWAGVPIVGGLLSGVLSPDNAHSRQGSTALAAGLGIPSLVFGLAGLISTFIAVANETTEEAIGPPRTEPRVSLAPAPGSDVGVGVNVEF